ncbi:nuclear protein [Suillus clintonianus]|uniref:nuclear protein n=1 Tax=Suillus clintonianus TaxID=1904413 RepID=UPI001B8867E8|nr:nuclear protein [Suillus clintonianus]KAG2156423.1 nuclear protein [Suillus clintonianus]
MSQVRERSHSLELSSDSLKRLKTTHSLLTPTVDHESTFYTGLFRPENVQQLCQTYAGSEPFKYAIVDKLFQDDLLVNVKDECMNELSFTERETDIYKVNQTGDLASLSYLSEAQLALFPNLLSLRDALYSSQFRKFIQAVTGCGPLSGTKQDMSVNSYTQGCHLLNHDDVIGTRRVSYILYMPLPYGQEWKKEWGGALELYPVQIGVDGIPEPKAAPCKAIPPSWNQFIFFEVQPGKSFHSVEEVVVGGDGVARLSISGWFHAAQEGEEGYQANQAAPELKSSREQLTSSSTAFIEYSDSSEPFHPDLPFRTEYISYLAKFLNPVYLQTRTMKALMTQFVAESSIELHHFLSASLVSKLEPDLRGADQADGLDGETRQGRIPPHSAGVSGAWSARGPPHKWRYCTLQKTTGPQRESDTILRQLQDEVFPSEAFRAWLSALTNLLPLSHAVEARRFRPGLDYTLATSEGVESRLDVVLGLTPQAEVEENETRSTGKSKANEEDKKPHGWQAGGWGGWECYMAPHDEEDDPAVYRSGSNKKSQVNDASGSQNHDDAAGTGEQEDDDDESTLLTVQPSFNRLLLVLRDEGVMRFVKYVSASAAGSRWDICGEFNVGMVQDDEEDEDS